MSEEQTPEISFADVLVALKDEQKPFPARYLYRLSGLEENELGETSLIWSNLSVQRRLGLLEDLELLAEGNTVMDFDSIYHMALSDVDPGVRTVAVRALWQSEDPAFARSLIKVMKNDESHGVSAQAAASLGRFIYLGELGKVPTGILKEIELVLLDAVRSDADVLIRRRALESLGYSSRPEIAELIEDGYEGDDEDWVASALFAMGRSADDRWEPLVIESLKDTRPEIAKEAARAAGELELSEAQPALFELLHAEDGEVRVAAAWALSQIGGQGVADALDELMERTEDEDEIDLIENALDNLSFTQEMGELNLLDFTPEDLEELANSDREDGEPPAEPE